MPCKSRVLVENDILNMKCDVLRKELKKRRLSTLGKKSELQSRLTESLKLLKEEGEEPVLENPEQENVEEAMETFTVESFHERTPTNAVSLVLDEEARAIACNDLGIDLRNFEVKSRTRVHRMSARKSLRATESSPRKTPSRIAEKFAAIHAKAIDKEETLGERHDRIQKRHEELTSAAPEAIRRLATPKSVKKRQPLDRSVTRSSTKTWNPQNPTDMQFQFGGDDVNTFSEVASNKMETGECSTSIKKSVPRARAHVGVKKLTRNLATPTRSVIPATYTDESTFVNYMATPKGVEPNKTPRRGAYTPYTGKKVFVDTTKLSDREHTLACEEGLIPGKRATKTKIELRHLETKKRRDEIIALKRKLDIK